MSKKLSWLDELKVKFPAMVVGDATPAASNANKHPRDAVLALIANSLALHANPEFTIKKRGMPTKPESCIKMIGGNAEIALRYSHELLTLPGGRTAITVPVEQLVPVLDALKAVVASKEFDTELESIKARRVAAQKGATSTKKKAA